MAGQQGPWQAAERARRYARHASLTSRLTYAPLARRVQACLEPWIEAPTIVGQGAGPGLLGIELGLRQARIIAADPPREMLESCRQNDSLNQVGCMVREVGLGDSGKGPGVAVLPADGGAKR